MTPASKNCPRCKAALQLVAGPPDKWVCPACGVRFAARMKPPLPQSARTAPSRQWLPMLAIPGVGIVLGVVLLIVHHTRSRPDAEPVAVAAAKTIPPHQQPPASPAKKDSSEPPSPSKAPVETVKELPPRPAQPAGYQPPPFAPLLGLSSPPAQEAEKAKKPEPSPRPAKPPSPPKNGPPPSPKPSGAPPSPRRINQSIERGVAYLKARLDDSFRPYGPLGPAGYRTGVIALAGLALLECGVPADDPAVRRAAEQVRSGARKLIHPYEVSVAIWFFDRLGEAQDRELIRALALQLIAAQTSGGGWGYVCRPLTDAEADRLTRMLEEPPPTDPSPLVPPAVRFRTGQKPRPGEIRYDDNSSTQFAILALWVARKHGVPVERSLAMVEERFRTSQNSDGSWCYFSPLDVDGSRVSGSIGGRRDSMTCAGLLGLAVAHGLGKPSAGPRETVKDPAVTSALVFLGHIVGKSTPIAEAERARLQKSAEGPKKQQEQFLTGLAQLQDMQESVYPTIRELLRLQEAFKNVPRDARVREELQRSIKEKLVRKIKEIEPLLKKVKRIVREIQDIQATGDHFQGQLVHAQGWGDLYFLWSLERMAVVYGLRTIAGKDWYAWGSAILVAAQNDDGSWTDAFPGVVDTCFALLFLKRANVAKDLTKQLEFLGIKDASADEINKAAARKPSETPSTIPKDLAPDEIGKELVPIPPELMPDQPKKP
jgi:hypothetical protein